MLCGLFAILYVIGILAQKPAFYFSKYAPAIIHYTSYYENGKICSKINEKYYIKIFGDNLASISPFIGKINNGIWQYDKEKQFIIKQCN
ncbi:hypothetical protein ACWIUD_04715 [Helicobacter sp. 23-1044]